MCEIYLQPKTALVVSDRKARLYFTKKDVAEGIIVITNKESVCFTDARYYSAVIKKLDGSSVKPLLMKGKLDVCNYLKENKVKTVLLDFDKDSVSDFIFYKEQGFKVKNGNNIISDVRAIKRSFEIENIEKACRITQTAYHLVIKQLKVGMTEEEVKDMLEKSMFSLGATRLAFETIVAFGSNSAVPHHETGKTELKSNSVVLIDMGCEVNGYCSDITRTAFFGCPDAEFIKNYNHVLKANLLAIDGITHGLACNKADAIAREYLKENGLDGYFTHSLGHGIGLEVHESFVLSPKSEKVLKNQMVFSIEPGVYFNGKYGIRIEDTVMLENGKVKRLFTDDKKLIIL